jgi:hypothetical protein
LLLSPGPGPVLVGVGVSLAVTCSKINFLWVIGKFSTSEGLLILLPMRLEESSSSSAAFCSEYRLALLERFFGEVDDVNFSPYLFIYKYY